MWTAVPDICNVLTAPHIQSWIFDWTYLRCCLRYTDICMRVILQIWCQIQRTSPSLRCVNCGPVNIQSICSSAFLGFNIQLWLSALPLHISRQFNARYTANLVPSKAHVIQFTQCVLWSRTYTMHLQFLILRPQYSTVGIRDAITDIPTHRCALYCKFGVKYSAHPPVYSIWTVIPAIYNVFTGSHSQATIFNWTYLRCYWRYLDNSMLVILQTWRQILRTSSSLRYVNCGPGNIHSIYSSL
jgi:hypothetical protein